MLCDLMSRTIKLPKLNSYKAIIKATSLFSGVQGLNIILNIIRTKMVAIIIGPDGVALNSIYNESRELLHSTSNLGLDVSGVRGLSKAYEDMTAEENGRADATLLAAMRRNITEEVAVLRSWVMLLALVGMLLCVLLSAPLSLMTFKDYDHVWGYVMLSPAVAFSTITCGELAVLKGLRRLKWIATVSLLNVVAGLVVSIPIYYVWGVDGVLAALVTLGLVTMLVACFFGYRAEPLRLVMTGNTLRKGCGMLAVGANFVVCSIIGHLAVLGILSYLNNYASQEMVGLYSAGYTMTMTYAGMVFAAMETDYFPRLSGVVTKPRERAETLLRQQDVSLILIVPLLAAMIVVLPVLVPLFLSGEFESIVPMAQVTTVGLVFRAVYLPNAYVSLAAGDNKTFLIINIIGAIDILLVIAGYRYYGLIGAGIALTVQNFIDMVLVMAISKWKYGVAFTLPRLLSLGVFVLLLAATYACSRYFEGWNYWIAGIVMTVVTVLFSYNRYKMSWQESA